MDIMLMIMAAVCGQSCAASIRYVSMISTFDYSVSNTVLLLSLTPLLLAGGNSYLPVDGCLFCQGPYGLQRCPLVYEFAHFELWIAIREAVN